VSTFVYHSYIVIINTIMFTAQPDFYGDWVIPNIIMTVIVAIVFIKILYDFTRLKDREQHFHQQLWCGDVVDSSDEEEANAKAKHG